MITVTADKMTTQVHSPRRRSTGMLRRWTVRLAWSVFLVFATLVVGGALDARRRLADLQPWHRVVPRDFRASDLTPKSTLADYLAIEDGAFRTVEEEVEQKLAPEWRIQANRYNPDAHSSPRRMGTNWNRTQVLTPSGEPIAGALMVHGLTDTPYSMRTLGEQLQARGYYAVALRVPGH